MDLCDSVIPEFVSPATGLMGMCGAYMMAYSAFILDSRTMCWYC